MLSTPLCDLFGIDHPVVQGPFGTWTSAGLVAAVSEAGALGSLGASGRAADEIRRETERIRDLTARPFAVNHIRRTFDEEAFAATLAARPAVVSFALGSPAGLVERAHEAGCLFMQQVHTVEQAVQAAELGADAVIAQGTESGGFGGVVAALALVPQVVDAVAPVPVVAAGGIADGRGLAAALVLGAQGVNVGTRFLACEEADRVPEEWKRRIVEARSEDAVKVEFWNEVMPPAEGSYATTPRSLRTAFLDRWASRPEELAGSLESVRDELEGALGESRFHELVPFAGQTVGLIREVLSAREIVRGMAAEAERALGVAARAVA